MTIYDFEARTIKGDVQKLSQYKGQVLLIVNTASQCGFALHSRACRKKEIYS